MSLGSPLVVAFIRGLLTALGQAMFTGIVTYQATGSGEDAVLVGALTFLSALGIRGGVEGMYDQRRNGSEKPQEGADEGEVRDFGDDLRKAQQYRVEQEAIFLGEDYHYGPRDGKVHRGQSPAQCAVCVHDGFV